MFRRPATQALLALVLLAVAGQAFAICSPTRVYEVYVGDKPSDAACTYNDIQSALSATYACPTTIRITREHLWTSQHLSVSNKNLTLQGEADGVSCYQMANCIPAGGCHAFTTTPLVTLDGNNSQGQSSDRVLNIDGGNITLRDLAIEHGKVDSDSHGGGVAFTGTGSLTLDTTTVSNNLAGYGGGVFVNGAGSGATIRLNPYTYVANNTASHNGGGIDIEGNTRLFALHSPATIVLNHAPNGDGGGLMVVGPARADLGGQSSNGSALVSLNDAAYGGGISAIANQNTAEAATVRLFTSDPRFPGAVDDNYASQNGGGVYLNPYSIGAGSVLCATDFRLDHNSARNGTAIFLEDHPETDQYVGAKALLSQDASEINPLCTVSDTIDSLGAVRCARDASCNVISNNTTDDGSGNPTDGSTIRAGMDDVLDAEHFALRSNQAQHVLLSEGSSTILRSCLIVDNRVSGELLYLTVDYDGAPFDMKNCTLANDSINNPYAIYGNLAQISLTDSILREGTTVYPIHGDNQLTAHYVLSHYAYTLPNAPDIWQGDPTFVDEIHGDYHLTSTSEGLDMAPAEGGVDLDGNTQDIDLPSVPNSYGPRDLGAYERENLFHECGASDSVFCDGFDFANYQ